MKFHEISLIQLFWSTKGFTMIPVWTLARIWGGEGGVVWGLKIFIFQIRSLFLFEWSHLYLTGGSKRSVFMATVVWHNFVLWLAFYNLDFNIFAWHRCCDIAWQFSDMGTVWSFDAYVSLAFEKERSGCFTSVFGSFLKWKIDKLWMGF